MISVDMVTQDLYLEVIPSWLMEEDGSSRTPGSTKRGMIGRGLLGYQSEGFIFLDGYQIQRRDPLVIQASQLAPKNPDLASDKAWVSFI